MVAKVPLEIWTLSDYCVRPVETSKTASITIMIGGDYTNYLKWCKQHDFFYGEYRIMENAIKILDPIMKRVNERTRFKWRRVTYYCRDPRNGYVECLFSYDCDLLVPDNERLKDLARAATRRALEREVYEIDGLTYVKK